MNILERIVASKRVELHKRKATTNVRMLERQDLFSHPRQSLKAAITATDSKGIIAEFKRRSPSKGVINAGASPEETTQGYVRAGASALSVLTDTEFFGGSNDDLIAARKVNACPILRKDFTIDEYQIVEARAIGADAILLIAAVLDPLTTKRLAALAHDLGLEVLLEVHNEAELLANATAGADLIGVNNRDLKTFTVSTEVSKKLAPMIPEDVVRVSESGISDPSTILDLRNHGYRGFLIGENFMKDPNPPEAAADFISRLSSKVLQ